LHAPGETKLCRVFPAQLATGGVVQLTPEQGSPVQVARVASQLNWQVVSNSA